MFLNRYTLPVVGLILLFGRRTAAEVDSASCQSDDGRCAGLQADTMLQKDPGMHLLQQALDRAPRRAMVVDSGKSTRSSVRAGLSTQPIMKDVAGSFWNISDRSKVMEPYKTSLFPKGYWKGYMPYAEHFQGVQRQQNSTYLYISGAGETEHKAQFFVIDVGSRKPAGALGNNHVSKEGYLPDAPAEDALVKVVRFDSEFDHAGGFSSFGDYVAIGAEQGCTPGARMSGTCKEKSRIYFFDMSDPAAPVQLPYIVDRPDATAGAVAITQESDGKFLLMVGRTDSKILDFYRSTSDSLSDPGFKPLFTWYSWDLLVGNGEWKQWESYQTLNFVRQEDGKLFMLGTTRTLFGIGQDVLHLFEVDGLNSEYPTIKKVGSKHLTCPSGTCNFYAGAGVYVESPTHLYVYATNWEPNSGHIVINEFRGSSEGVGGHGKRYLGSSCSSDGKCQGEHTRCWEGACFCKINYEIPEGEEQCVLEAQ